MADQDHVAGHRGDSGRWWGGLRRRAGDRAATGTTRQRGRWRAPGGRVRRWVTAATVAGLLASCSSAPASDDGRSPSGGQLAPGTPVEIGLPYPANLAGLSAMFGGALGGAPAPPSDELTENIYRAVVDHINNTGGLLGSRITPVFYGVDTTTAAGRSTEQEMCTSFTEDHHVFAVMAMRNHTGTLVSCLDEHNIVTFAPAGSVALDDTFFAEHPLYATAGAPSLDRVAAVEVNGLSEAGFFGPGAKVGLVGYDSEPFRRAIDHTLRPALARHGIELADEQLVRPVTGVADVGAAQQAVASAVLRFRNKGIDHVLFLDTEGGTLSPWTKAATAQRYYPRLAFTTNQNPANRAFAGNTANPDQVNQFSTALAVGWLPGSDVTDPATNAAGAQCNEVMRSAGASAEQAQMFWSICDQLLAFAAGVNAGGELSPRAALEGLAKSGDLPSAELLGPLRYTDGRRDGVALARVLSFAPSCECFQYSSAPLTASLFESD